MEDAFDKRNSYPYPLVRVTSSTNSRPSGRAKYSDLFERLLDPVFLLDQESFLVLESNPAAELKFVDVSAQFSGQFPGQSGSHPSGPFTGRELTHWLDTELHEEFNRALRMARRSYHPRKIRLPWLTHSAQSDTPVLFEAVLCRLELDAGTSVIQVILHDVTLEMRARAEL